MYIQHLSVVLQIMRDANLYAKLSIGFRVRPI